MLGNPPTPAIYRSASLNCRDSNPVSPSVAVVAETSQSASRALIDQEARSVVKRLQRSPWRVLGAADFLVRGTDRW